MVACFLQAAAARQQPSPSAKNPLLTSPSSTPTRNNRMGAPQLWCAAGQPAAHLHLHSNHAGAVTHTNTGLCMVIIGATQAAGACFCCLCMLSKTFVTLVHCLCQGMRSASPSVACCSCSVKYVANMYHTLCRAACPQDISMPRPDPLGLAGSGVCSNTNLNAMVYSLVCLGQ